MKRVRRTTDDGHSRRTQTFSAIHVAEHEIELICLDCPVCLDYRYLHSGFQFAVLEHISALRRFRYF
jgi:hypothetical protein